jgi:hypothetical protein
MGNKSRSNWNIPICLRGDCRWQNTKTCNKCLRFSKYEQTGYTGSDGYSGKKGYSGGINK